MFQGGGVKGIALVGALTTLGEQGFLPQNLAGTSAGAIVATLYAAGYKASELRDIIGSLKFDNFLDTGWDIHRQGALLLHQPRAVTDLAGIANDPPLAPNLVLSSEKNPRSM